MKKQIRNAVIGLTAVVALGVVAAACGGGSDSSKTATPNTTATKPAGTPSAAATKAASPTAAVATATTAATAATPTAAPSTEPTTVPAPTQPVATLPPPPPAATPTVAPPPPPPPPPPPTGQSVTIVAKDTAFSQTSLTLPAGAPISLTLDNQDTGTAHDIVIYDTSGAILAQTEIAIGPNMETVNFTLGPPGAYAFKCSVHPQQMNGRITAQ